MSRGRGRGARRMPITLLTLLAAGAALTLAPWPAAWVEGAFSGGLFPLTSRVLAPLVGAVPFSLTGTLLAALLAAALATLATPRGRARFGRRLLRRWLPWTVAVALLWFDLAWGLAYRRDTLAQLLRISAGPPTAAQVRVAQGRLLDVVTGTAGTPSAGRADVAAAARCVAAEVMRVTGTRVDVPRRVKQLPPGTLLRAGFSGVTSPWLLEPHVDAALPPAAKLATATHELTHAAGFAREADTDALAVLAGLHCGDPAVRYALALHALLGLAAGMTPNESGTLLAALPQRARNDVRALDAASARYRLPWLQRATTAVYGTYLRSRGVSGGMADYGRAITLVVQALTRPGG